MAFLLLLALAFELVGLVIVGVGVNGVPSQASATLGTGVMSFSLTLFGIGLMIGGCFWAILARMAQASAYSRAALRASVDGLNRRLATNTTAPGAVPQPSGPASQGTAQEAEAEAEREVARLMREGTE